MKTFTKKDFYLLLFTLAPLFYLLILWNKMPENIPLHWNIEGKIDGRGSKFTLLFITLFMGPITHLLLTYLPKIDSKEKLQKMGNKYFQFKLILSIFLSLLCFFIIQSSYTESLSNPNWLLSLLGLLFVFLGNYMQTIQPNYFIGIRTPWTLENEEIWKRTHAFAGKLWFVGGILISVLCFILPNSLSFIVFISGIITLSLIPVGYSLWHYLRLKKTNNEIDK